MQLYKYFPKPSDRMGTIWTLSTIDNAYIVEFGPAGTTHFAIEGMMQLNAEGNASVFTTDMDDSDVAFGKTERLENTIVEIDKTYSPSVIFVMASSISAIIGTDVESVCLELEEKVNAKLIPITTGGYNGDYTKGIERTLQMLVKEVVEKNDNKNESYNIIGNNIDVFNFLSDKEEIESLMKNVFNLELNTTFTAYTSINEIENAAESKYNLVLRGEGLKAADTFKKYHNADYFYGRPYGLGGTMKWIEEISEEFNLNANRNYIKRSIEKLRKSLIGYKMMTRSLDNKRVVLVGEFDVVIGLSEFVEELGLEVSKIIVKHSVSETLKKTVEDKYRDIIEYDLNEMEIESFLSAHESYLTLGDGATLKLRNKTELKFQIANPNFTKHNIYPYTPFVGFNGALYFIQCLYELEKEKIAV